MSAHATALIPRKECSIIKKAISMMAEGPEKEAYKSAWDREPTYKDDCRLTRARKEFKRQEIIKRILNDKGTFYC